jgi:hypothetical protein
MPAPVREGAHPIDALSTNRSDKQRPESPRVTSTSVGYNCSALTDDDDEPPGPQMALVGEQMDD